MNGKPVGDVYVAYKAQSSWAEWQDLTRTVSGSPRQKRTARSMAKPILPFSNMVVSIALGIFKAAFSISSDIYIHLVRSRGMEIDTDMYGSISA